MSVYVRHKLNGISLGFLVTDIMTQITVHIVGQ